LLVGASVVYHANARDGKTIGRLCQQHGCTIFVSTSDLLPIYLAECTPGDFASIRLLWYGGEMLPPELAQSFQEKFDVLPLLGYGQTELSPAATLNVPDKDLDGFRQVGNQIGTIGQPLPGVAAQIVDPVTFASLPPGQTGILLFFGANVMVGYFNDAAATEQAIHDSWFITGILATMNEDGFITLGSKRTSRQENDAAAREIA
jgi:acyl-[acyl-carrier-protein]-phospholipid O-acyltransferase / long-chain-fatty-acid--[acyl-carrier-protein] ligase